MKSSLHWFAVAETGERVGFDMCFSPDCSRHVSRCTCDEGPTPPRLGASAGTVVVEQPAAASAA